MPYQDPFVQSETGFLNHPVNPFKGHDNVASKYFHNASAPRVNTDMYVYDSIKQANPGMNIIDIDLYSCDVIAYISATGDGSYSSISDSKSTTTNSGRATSHYNFYYAPPVRRLKGNEGALFSKTIFDKFQVQWRDHEFIMYVVDCRDGTGSYVLSRQFVLTKEHPGVAESFLKIVGAWENILHDEVWVFDQGYWQKDAELYAAVQKSRWDDIILPEELKEDLLSTVLRFYDAQDTYAKLRVPWKRGLIFYGPPGNGKTVSIKATMKTLLDRKESVPTLYVKSLVSYAGPEYSISQIFGKARMQAPCYLVFEDLDSLVTDQVRSFFLNAVDGLSENQGILMVGSTNHIERLDPGLAKRPSRFDRKYLFDNPDLEGRTAYCRYWQKKLKDNKDIAFPDELCPAIAKLMNEFSFAYMQEAFVSTLLKIATQQVDATAPRREAELENGGRSTQVMGKEGKSGMRGRGGERLSRTDETWDLVEGAEHLEIIEKSERGGEDDDLDKYLLFREIKLQIENLRKELE